MTPRCADLSEQADEQLSGTASTTRSWLLVEVPGTWPRDVSGGDGLPASARRGAEAWLERTPSSRLLFIRRPGRVRTEGELAFVVQGADDEGSIRRLEVADLERLDDLDQAGGNAAAAAPLVLVCAHGTRDACCALRGTAVYGALAATLGPEQVWISSHHGGHRFAANVLVLPAGIQLGRVAAAEASAVVGRALAGRIDLDRFRGCALYAPAVQAAEVAVRRALGLDGLGDLELVDVDGSTVRFRDPSGREHVVVTEERTGPVVPASCGAKPEPQVAFAARVV